MTPRTMEKFSDFIIQQRLEKSDPLDLREEAALMNPVHPKIIKAMLTFEDNPEQEPALPCIPGKYYACYKSIFEAEEAFPDLPLVKGQPFAVFQHLKTDALFDFSPYGVAALCSSPINKPFSQGLHQHTLPPFLEYALSQELWGPQGKWTRFHERLQTLFDKYKLLNGGEIYPGRYPLKTEAQKLATRGIQGTLKEGSLILTFPWSFPLSALIKLEAIIQEEF